MHDITPSFAAMVKTLPPGETISRTRRVPVASKEARDMNAVLRRLRNTVNQCVSKIRGDSGSNFRVESCLGLTDDKIHFLATVAVTNSDDDEDEADI